MVPSYFLFCRSSWYNNFFHAFYLDCKTLKVCYYIKGACEKLKFQFCSFSMNMVIFKFAVVNHIHSSIVFAVECRCKLYMRWFFLLSDVFPNLEGCCNNPKKLTKLFMQRFCKFIYLYCNKWYDLMKNVGINLIFTVFLWFLIV